MKRAGKTVTFSISVDQRTQRILKREAKRLFDGNVSKLVAALAREAERNAALDRYLEGVHIDEREYEAFVAEMHAKAAPKKRRRAA
jgi:hypothetical protein